MHNIWLLPSRVGAILKKHEVKIVRHWQVHCCVSEEVLQEALLCMVLHLRQVLVVHSFKHPVEQLLAWPQKHHATCIPMPFVGPLQYSDPCQIVARRVRGIERA